MAPLTQRQNEAYEFIRGYMDRHRKPPTMEEIGDALGISSTNGVYKLLRALEKKGWIEREKHAARGIQLTEEGQDPLGVGGDIVGIKPCPAAEIGDRLAAGGFEPTE